MTLSAGLKAHQHTSALDGGASISPVTCIPGALTIPNGIFLRRTVITATGNWTKGVGTRTMNVRLVGGGSATANLNIGGHAGGYAEKFFDVTATAAIETVAVTIGAGGVAPDGAGGSTSFGAYFSATGGPPPSSNTLGGIGVNGDINVRGGSGTTSGNGGIGSVDVGGSNPLGGGPRGDTAGQQYGTGGSVVSVNQNGAAGVVIVEEFA